MSANPEAARTALARVAVVMPVLNDWRSATKLLFAVKATPGMEAYDLEFVLADDGSTDEFDFRDAFRNLDASVHLLRLASNQGHQRAIALGLAYVRRSLSVESVIVMDSDGEDKPEDVPRLLSMHSEKPRHIISAVRTRRSESPIFKAFYQVYKLLFQALTGRVINFGNFSLIPAGMIGNVVTNAGVWNNFAATVLRSRVPLAQLPIERGKRYFGTSHMNFTALMLHGMGAISVFSDVVVGRLLTFISAMSALFVSAIACTLAVRLLTRFFIPGDATMIILILFSMLVNVLVLGLMLIMVLLNMRTFEAVSPESMLDKLAPHVDVLPQGRPRVATR